jgi:hypothetical protein
VGSFLFPTPAYLFFRSRQRYIHSSEHGDGDEQLGTLPVCAAIGLPTANVDCLAGGPFASRPRSKVSKSAAGRAFQAGGEQKPRGMPFQPLAAGHRIRPYSRVPARPIRLCHPLIVLARITDCRTANRHARRRFRFDQVARFVGQWLVGILLVQRRLLGERAERLGPGRALHTFARCNDRRPLERRPARTRGSLTNQILTC